MLPTRTSWMLAISLLMLVVAESEEALAERDTDTRTVEIALQPLRNLGGIETGLNSRLTRALGRYLVDNCGRDVSVVTKTSIGPNRTSSAELQYICSGDLSCTEPGSDGNVTYMCTVRLYRQGRQRTLIGQWAAASESLRSLTANLRHDPRFSELGLVGELGARILRTTIKDSSDPGKRLLAVAGRLKHLNGIECLPTADGHLAKAATPGTIRTVRLRMTGVPVGQVQVLLQSTTGQLSIYAFDAPWKVNGSGVSEPIQLSLDSSAVLVLFKPVQRSRPSTDDAVQVGRTRCSAFETGPPSVQVLNGSEDTSAPLSAGIESLLQEIGSDLDSWQFALVSVKPSH